MSVDRVDRPSVRSAEYVYEPPGALFPRVMSAVMFAGTVAAGLAAVALRGGGWVGPPAAIILMWLSLNLAIAGIALTLQGTRPLGHRLAYTFAADVALGVWAASWSAPVWCAAAFAVWVIANRLVAMRACPPNRDRFYVSMPIWFALELSGLVAGWGAAALLIALRH